MPRRFYGQKPVLHQCGFFYRIGIKREKISVFFNNKNCMKTNENTKSDAVTVYRKTSLLYNEKAKMF